MRLSDRRAFSLVEVLCILGPAILVLGVAITLLARGSLQDRWNGGRLQAVDCLVLAKDRIETDLWTAGRGDVEPTEGRLVITRNNPSARTADRQVMYEIGTGSTLFRNGQPLSSIHVDGAECSWADEGRGLLTIGLARKESRDAKSTPLQPINMELNTVTHVPDHGARSTFSGWSDE